MHACEGGRERDMDWGRDFHECMIHPLIIPDPHAQLWKSHRIGKGDGDTFRLSRLVSETDSFTAVGVELSAGLGAWCFFVGTGLYEVGPLEGPGSVVPLVLQVRGRGRWCCR